MKRAVIFLHGTKPKKELIKRYIKRTDTIICADGGTIWAIEAGLVPNVYIGDLDSITPALYKKLQNEGTEMLTYHTEKDKTDSELALDYALHHGYKDILLFGMVGNRIDHMLANVALFAEAVMQGNRILIISEEQEIHFVDYHIELLGKPGEYVSLIPLKQNATGVTTEGLKWRLYNDTLSFGSTMGISNEFIRKKAKIIVEKGILMVIHTRR